MKPRLLKSRDFGRLIRAPNHCFETIDSQKVSELHETVLRKRPLLLDGVMRVPVISQVKSAGTGSDWRVSNNDDLSFIHIKKILSILRNF